MKILALSSALFLSACSIGPAKIDTAHGAAPEQLECMRSASNTVKFGNYKLVFLSRDFTSMVQVWMNPDDGRVVVLKKREGKVCYVSNSLPNTIFVPYDKDARKIINAVESND